MNLIVHCPPLSISPTRRQGCQDGFIPSYQDSLALYDSVYFLFVSLFHLSSNPETLPWARWNLEPVIIQIPQTHTQFSECPLYLLALQKSVSSLKTLWPPTLLSIQIFLPSTSWPQVLLDSQWRFQTILLPSSLALSFLILTIRVFDSEHLSMTVNCTHRDYLSSKIGMISFLSLPFIEGM